MRSLAAWVKRRKLRLITSRGAQRNLRRNLAIFALKPGYPILQKPTMTILRRHFSSPRSSLPSTSSQLPPVPAFDPHSHTAGTYAADLADLRRGFIEREKKQKKRSYVRSVLRLSFVLISSVVLATYMANVAVTYDKEQRVIHLMEERKRLRGKLEKLEN
ncbi:hypothetical protein DFS34DRAFT_511849 [Phlyctochytrium arcticum]|nr:hypothetical protein DFS34DRAFT_511849 [Phlyctochytrium arcticum]